MTTRLLGQYGMARAVRWCVASLLVMMAGCASTPPAPREITLAGVVVDAQRVAGPSEAGLVRVEREGQVFEGHGGMTLQAGDWVMTGPNAYALIRYPSGTELFMRPNTRGRVGSFTDVVGEVFAKIRGAFAIQTSFVKAGAEGTAYSVRGSPDGDYAVVVFDGTVRLYSLNGAWAPLALGRGTMSAGRPHVPPRPMPAPPEELARTRAWVERMETLLPRPPNYAGAGAALAIAGLVAIIAANQDHSSDEALAAPTGLSPAGPAPQQAALAQGCYPLRLTWHAVRGARDYVVRLAPVPGARIAAASATPNASSYTSAAPSLTLPRVASGLYRWDVNARDGRGRDGPASAPGYFRCPG